MAKPDYIELSASQRAAILYEDRAVLALDKPRGWMLAPDSWQATSRNLQSAIAAGIAARQFWAASRNLKYLRFVHRLDADTTGVLLMAKSPGALRAMSRLFETRRMTKLYLAVVGGVSDRQEWTCRLKLAQHPDDSGRIRTDPRGGQEAQTTFSVLQTVGKLSLVVAQPATGRTHQVRVHLAESGCPVVGDLLYGRQAGGASVPASRNHLGLRAVVLAYADPFTGRRVRIEASTRDFLREFGFEADALPR